MNNNTVTLLWNQVDIISVTSNNLILIHSINSNNQFTACNMDNFKYEKTGDIRVT
jgi:hypothetical protein